MLHGRLTADLEAARIDGQFKNVLGRDPISDHDRHYVGKSSHSAPKKAMRRKR